MKGVFLYYTLFWFPSHDQKVIFKIKHLNILLCVYCPIALQVSSLNHGCVLGFTLYSNQKVCFLTGGTMCEG